MGINRGPSLGFAVLLALGWDPVDAIAAIRAARPQANVWYAADALRWHHDRHGVDAVSAAAEHRALEAWRDAHPLDVVRLIREQRARGCDVAVVPTRLVVAYDDRLLGWQLGAGHPTNPLRAKLAVEALRGLGVPMDVEPITWRLTDELEGSTAASTSS